MVVTETLFNRAIEPVLKNFTGMLLTWALVAYLHVTAADQFCKNVELGALTTVVYLALGLNFKTAIFVVIGFYFLVALFYAATGQGGRAELVQDKFLRPFAVPFIFQLAGLFAGSTMMSTEHGGVLMAIAVSLLWAAFALSVHNSAFLFRKAFADA
jgi:hypothetical protein